MGELKLIPDEPQSLPAVKEAAMGEMTVTELKKRLAVIHTAMRDVMAVNVDYGKIPGTNKPTLMKPGAEKLCVLFQFGGKPSSIIKTYDGPHLTVDVEYELFHIPTGRPIGTGVGSCSTKESKYAYRKGQRLCPDCGKDTIRKDKREAGYYCWSKIGGCGAQFKSAEAIRTIEEQKTDRVENADLPDQYNTILKMAKKRAKIDATLDATGASAIFTQDVEDFRRGAEDEPDPIAPIEDEPQKPAAARDPNDKATPDEKAALVNLADEHFGKGKGKDWCNKALADRGHKKWGEVTVRTLALLVEQMEADPTSLVNKHLADAPEPIMEEEDLPF
jgi:hypothetical protein